MARGETIAGLDIGTTKTCAVIAASGPDGLEIIGVGEAPSTRNAQRRRHRPRGDRSCHRGRDREGRAHGGRARLARLRRRHRRAHAVDEQPRRRRRHRRGPRGDRERRQARRRRVQDHQPRRRPPDHSLAAAPLHDRRPGRRDRPRRHERRAARGGHAHRHRRIAASSRTCSSACIARGSSRPASCSSRSPRRQPRCCPKRSRSASCCSTSAAARPTSPCSPTAACCTRATIPVGGNILTNDIALGLKTTFAEAENVKRTYGSGLVRSDEADQTFQVKTLDGRSTREVTSSQLRAIVVPRVLEIFRLAQARTSSSASRATKC